MTPEQQSLMAVFNRILDFMDAEGIRYYMLGGTAIGALRHEGFIPWDDDLDIMLELDEYHKLIDAAQHLPWDDIEFICSETDPLYYRPYARFSYKKDTMFMKSGMFNHGKCMGTMIDVFPLYDVPSRLIDDFRKDFVLYQEVLALPNIYNNAISEYTEDYFALKDREKTEGRENVIRQLREKVKSYSAMKDCDRKVVGLWERGVFRVFDSSWFEGEPKYYPFEGRMLPVPAGNEACLRYQYGYDWYRIPENEEQITHKLYRDTEISANNYYADMDLFVDWEEADRLLDEKKRAQVSKLGMLKEIENYKDEMLAHRIMMRSGLAPGELHELASAQEYSLITDKASAIISNFRCFEAANGVPDIEDGDIEAIIIALIYTGRYYDADRIADSLQLNRESDAAGLLERTTALAAAYQDHDTDRTAAALDAFSSEEKVSVPECIRVYGEMLIDSGAAEPEIQEQIKVCRSYLDRYESNSDIRKIMADLLMHAGEEAEAESLYKRVLAESRNGLDILELEKKLSYGNNKTDN